MSERKVLNKYYPPDFDPSKIPKGKKARNATFCIRIMVPFNCRCNNCGEYIYKGKKFNSRKEDAAGEYYLGLQIFRFYIKCPRCVSEIAFKTDLVNCDYELEAGATRNFEAAKTAEKMAIQEQKLKDDEELNNPMKVLENRTKASQREMEQIDLLEELKEMNARHANLNHEDMLKAHMEYEKKQLQIQEDEDEKFINSMFGKDGTTVKRLPDVDESSGSGASDFKKPKVSVTPTDHPASTSTSAAIVKKPRQKSSSGGFKAQSCLAGFIKKKAPSKNADHVT